MGVFSIGQYQYWQLGDVLWPGAFREGGPAFQQCPLCVSTCWACSCNTAYGKYRSLLPHQKSEHYSVANRNIVFCSLAHEKKKQKLVQDTITHYTVVFVMYLISKLPKDTQWSHTMWRPCDEMGGVLGCLCLYHVFAFPWKSDNGNFIEDLFYCCSVFLL